MASGEILNALLPAAKRGVALLAAASALCLLGAGPAAMRAHAADQTEIVFATFLDPNNQNDPRAAAQTRMIQAFEAANASIKVTVQVDSTQQASLRALRSRSATPDLFRMSNWEIPEFVASGSVLALDDLVKRDKVDESDWLLPLHTGAVDGHLYGMPQDFRIPILIYRKSLLAKAGVTPPKTWDEVCKAGGQLNQPGVIGYPVPVGSSGGMGGAQPLAENLFSSMASEGDGQYFAANDRDLAMDKGQTIATLQVMKDLFGKCKATPQTTLQFGYSEVHDGLRAGTIAMATFGLFRYRAIEKGGAEADLAWAPPPAFKPDGKLATYGYHVSINANTAHTEAAWQFAKFMGSPEAQALAAEGGEVVARASVYTKPYFDTPNGQVQKQWAELVKARGRVVHYSMLATAFNQILGDAVQRMILRDTTPEAAYEEIVAKYNEALKRSQ
ncbi:MAG TPA: sugar ABC transporter substrate-binding protein [Stellaceae bacterium]|nr:sugar ABC transporter substrate-binding protein [Stellaceae bacterium]